MSSANLQLPLLLKSVRVIDPAKNSDTRTDLFIDANGHLRHPPAQLPTGTLCVDARKLVATPGLWDIHVHFRDPGNPAAETSVSGAMAAAAGGFTHVVTMPNTAPPCDNVAQIKRQLDPALPVRILPSAAITVLRNGGKVGDLSALAEAGAAVFTDDGTMVADDNIMAAAMRLARTLNRTVMDHAVVPSIAGNGVIRDCPLAQQHNWSIFPAAAEVEAVARDLRLCRKTGCATHIQHISCGGSVELLRQARRDGLPATGEVTPHHLAIATEDIPGDDGNYRMNPPLGTREDVIALRQGVLDGTVTCYATDHAPHTIETKTRGFPANAPGVIGLETAAGVTYTIMVEQAGQPLQEWVACWTTGPAAALGLPLPALSKDAPADLVLLDLHTNWQVNPSGFKSRSRNTPFAGQTLRGRAVLTICNGRITHSVLEDNLLSQA